MAGQKYPDRWVDPEDDPREDGGSSLGDERATLLDTLRCQRLTMQMKCDGLDAGAMARRSVAPSTMSLLGLVRHMAEVERSWFRRILAGNDVPKLYCAPDNRDGDWDDTVADDACVAEAWRNWRDECAFSDRFIAEHTDLGITDPKKWISLREVLVHMVEEYARHNGHADLLRERIDGRTGQ